MMRMVIVAICIFISIQFADAQKVKKGSNLFDWEYNSEQECKQGELSNPKKLPLIKVKGNRFVNEIGDTILFRGVAIADPDKIDQQGKWNRKLFEKVKEFGASIVRIPVHPPAWRMRTPYKYLQLLDQAVNWCTELGMYVIIDWHSIGNLSMELFQSREYVATRQETYKFWRTIASHYRGHNTVAFYELFNEPTTYFGQLGSISWAEWEIIMENLIKLIRAYDIETIPLVAGFDWAYDLTPLRLEPIDAEGIGYVVHPYSHKRKPPFTPKWEEAFGFAAEKYPLFATEFGFGTDSLDGFLQSDTLYGEEIIEYLENKGISWACWVFDPDWRPQLIKSWNTFELTVSGKFFNRKIRQ